MVVVETTRVVSGLGSIRDSRRIDLADIGAFVDMRYEGKDVDGSVGTVGIGKAIEVVLLGPPTLPEPTHAGLLDGLKQMVAHGRITYRSDQIVGSGRDELKFCFQFDPDTRSLVGYRPLLSESDPKQKEGH